MDEKIDYEFDADPEPQQACESDSDEAHQRLGNNRYHIPKLVAKAKRKAAKIARRKNRK